MQTFAAIQEIIGRTLGVDPLTVSQGAFLREDLRIEPALLVAILIAIEEHFGVAFAEEDVDDFRTVRDLIHAVKVN